MQPMKERNAADGIAHHSALPARVYETTYPQEERILKSRHYLASAIGDRKGTMILEVGCGTADICGPFAEEHSVLGLDCNPNAISVARQRFPTMNAIVEDITTYKPLGKYDVVVMCETLEHIPDPVEMATRFITPAEYSVVSHPFNEDVNCGLSGGDHQWSFGMADFENWFKLGGHELIQHEVFKMGCYEIIIGYGKRK